MLPAISKTRMHVAVPRLLLQTSQFRRLPYRAAHNSSNRGFLGSLLDNIRDELSKSKEMKASIKKFREEANKLEQSEALKEARRKYKTIEKETIESGHYVRERVDELSEKVLKSDFAQQAAKISGRVSATLKSTTETLSKAGAEISKTEAAKAVSSTLQGFRDHLEDVTSLSEPVRMYQSPTMLKKRSELSAENSQTKADIKGDNETTNIVVHKDWSWYESWQNFRDNNAYMNKIFEFKTRYDESDNAVIRATRFLTETISEKLGSMLVSKTEFSEALNEIHKIDSNFNIFSFMRQVEQEIAPNVFGALSERRLDILRDWCYEAVFNVLSYELKQAESVGNQYHFKIFDISEVEFAAGKVMEQGPIIVVTFNTQQISYITDPSGKVSHGNPDKLKSVVHVWALCRDQSIPDTHACWRLIDMSTQERGELAL